MYLLTKFYFIDAVGQLRKLRTNDGPDWLNKCVVSQAQKQQLHLHI